MNNKLQIIGCLFNNVIHIFSAPENRFDVEVSTSFTNYGLFFFRDNEFEVFVKTMRKVLKGTKKLNGE